VAVGHLSPPPLRPGGLAIGVSSLGIRDIWVYRKPLAREEALRLFSMRLSRVGSVPSPECGPRARALLLEAIRELKAYFRGELRRFSCPLDLGGRATPFQARIWEALQAIPYGETRSYGEIARALRQPHASRAVGRSCGQNPLPVIVPCHRVVGSDGSLTGFSAGLPLKTLLLSIEGVETRGHGRSSRLVRGGLAGPARVRS